MDLPTTDAELVPEKEKIEDGKEGIPAFHCDLYDTEIVHKVAQRFLPGLGASCVDNTTGGIFRSPASVAVDLRKEMIEYLTMRSENFVAESVILDGDPDTEVSDHPYDIISDFIDDFASSKRNFFSRVSGWVLSETREDKIDDFVQEMETNGFWLTDRREAIAQTLVKNVDFKNTCHCDKKFNTAEELAEHVISCEYRTMNCPHEGCTIVYSARHMEKHDSVCPFKIIPCEQNCSESIMRRGMDRHCITLCPMKLVNCPFYGVGCQSSIPRCMIQQHCLDELQLHLTYALKNIHKGAAVRDLKNRANQIVEISSGQLQGSKDARSLTLRVKDLDARLGPLEITPVEEEPSESENDSTEKSNEPANEHTERSTESIERTIDNVDKSSELAIESIVKSSERAIDNANKSIEPTKDYAEKSNEHAIDNAIKFSERAIDNAEKSTGPSSYNTNKSTEPESDNANKSTEHALDNADKSTDRAIDNADKLSERAIDSTGKSIEPASAKKPSELSSDNANKSTEPGIDNADYSSERSIDDSDRSAEPAINNNDKFTDPASDNANKSSVHAIDNVDKFTEPASVGVEKSINSAGDNANKSPEPTSDNADKLTEPRSDNADRSIEPTSDNAAKSGEPASDNANKPTEADTSMEPSETINSRTEKSTSAPNKVLEDSVGTAELAARGSEEAKLQAST
ncbi:TRAF-like superfamily protein [Euphorbia peplus]|nr:TRAF-like superfamily protein [Euphorbia peplus]